MFQKRTESIAYMKYFMFLCSVNLNIKYEFHKEKIQECVEAGS
jgi:hypothetical protein